MLAAAITLQEVVIYFFGVAVGAMLCHYITKDDD